MVQCCISEINKDTGEKEGICLKYKDGKPYCVYQIKDGQETDYEGYFKFFSEQNQIWSEGYYKDGTPNGYGEEYDTEGKYIFKGLYDNGRKLTIKKMSGSGGYQKEYDSLGQVVNICKRDENNRFEGICYHHDSDGIISRISEFSEGKEVRVLAKFCAGLMEEYQGEVTHYQGEYHKKTDFEYVPNGLGLEYDSDGETLIYKGFYLMGKRHGLGKLYQDGEVVYDGLWILDKTKSQYYIRYFIIAIVIIAVLVSLPFIFMALNLETALMIDLCATTLFFLYCLKVYCCPIKNDLEYLIAKMIHKGTLKVDKDCFNYTYSFVAPLFLKKIDIRNHSFLRCYKFRVDGLHRLKSLKIGDICFCDLELKDWDINIVREFEVMNCKELKSIEIGGWSFAIYNSTFNLNNLPSLRKIKIGEFGTDKSNFSSVSLNLHGIVININVMVRFTKFRNPYFR